MRFFDVPEANRLVPYLDRAFREVRSLLEQARKLAEQMDQLEPSQTAQLRRECERALLKSREELNRVEELGLEVKSVEGLVDFRAILEDREVYLCWRFGEEAVTHWHELDAGFDGRKPIDPATPFEPCYLS